MGNLTSTVNGEKRWDMNRVFPLAVRLALGGIFLYASLDKILHPAAFAKAVYNYQILPETFINLAAIVLPWVELILGVFLILGVWLPGATFLSSLLLLIFFSAILFNLLRGLDIHCGCFGSTDTVASGGRMVWYVMRDAFFVLLALYLFSHTLLLGRRRAREKVSQ